MGILDEFKKLSEESNSSIVVDKDVLEEINRQKQLIDEYNEKGTINGVTPEIKQSEMNSEFPDGIDPKMERDASMDEYPDGASVEDTINIDPIMQRFNDAYTKYHESDLTIIRSKDYEPVVVSAYCPQCGKEIISTAPVMFNPYTMDKICKYDCECGWKGNLDYAYPRLVMVNKNTGEELEVYAK